MDAPTALAPDAKCAHRNVARISDGLAILSESSRSDRLDSYETEGLRFESCRGALHPIAERRASLDSARRRPVASRIAPRRSRARVRPAPSRKSLELEGHAEQNRGILRGT